MLDRRELEARYIRQLALKEELYKRAAERSLYEFYQQAWPQMDPAEFSGNWHLQGIAEHLEAVNRGEIKRLVVNVPPRSSKTKLISYAWPSWTWLQDKAPLAGPQVGFIFASYALNLSLEHAVGQRRLVKSPWYQERWGERFRILEDQDKQIKFENDVGGHRTTTSVDGTLTGRGAEIICIDDPHNVVDAESKTTRESVIKWFREALPSRLNNQKEGAIVVVMQRVHEEDVSGAALEMGYEHLMIPMEFDEGRKCVTSIGWEDPRETDGELMWPDKFPRPVVDRLKTALDSYAYAGQYQQAPTPRGGGIIKREWWNEWENPDPNRKNHFPKFSYVVASLDPAYTEKQENDYSAFSMWGVFHESEMHRGYNTPVLKPKVMLIWAWRDRLPLHELVQKVHNDCVKYRADTLLVEAKASGISVQQEMRRMFSTGDYGIQMINPRGDKVARVQAISHFFYDGMVYAPPKRWAQAVVDQVSVFPKGAHDDDVDAMSQALLHLRQTGVLVRKEEAYTAVDNEAREPVRRAPLYPC